MASPLESTMPQFDLGTVAIDLLVRGAGWRFAF
jgi:hypothetical protein